MADKTPSTTGDVPAEADLVTQIVDRIVDTIAKVRENTVDRIDKIAKYIVYGLFIGIIGSFMLFGFVILLVRVIVILTDVVMDEIGDDGDNHQVWFAHLFVGILFSLGGAFAWKKRPPLET